MGIQPSPRVVGRLAGLLLVASGALSAVTLPLPQPAGIDKLVVLLVSGIAVAVGGVTFVLPWHRWHPRASLALLPIAFALMAAGNYYGNAQPYTYSIFFIAAFVWIGLGHPRWTSLLFVPPATVAFIAPILMAPTRGSTALSAVALVMPVCAFVAETIAWMGSRERRSRERTSALAAVAEALGAHLDVEALCQTLATEARAALGAELASFVRLGDGKIEQVYTAGFDATLGDRFKGLEGRPYTEGSPFDQLALGEPVVVEDTGQSGRRLTSNPENVGLRSYIAIPVMVGADLVGILSCAELTRKRRYSPDDIALARALAASASAAIRNAIEYTRTLEASLRDPLTELGNRRAFHENLDTEVERARRYGRPLSLIVLDVDHLKNVNDAWGHTAGDAVLEQVAALLKETSRREDHVYRIGGDEFALVLPETPLDGASIVAERIRKSVEHGRVGMDGQKELTISLGVAAFPTHGLNPEELYERADTAMYEVKWSGRNAVATATLRDQSAGDTRFGVDIRAIIESDRLVPLYQPIVHLEMGVVSGFEALCRLDPSFGSSPTTTLFRAAGALGLTDQLERCCVRTAMNGARDLGESHLLFVNITPAVVETDKFDVAMLLTSIGNAGLDPSQVVLELTSLERAFTPRLVTNLEQCRTFGLGIALDDFSPSKADFDLVTKLRFDYVKIDAVFSHGEDRAARRPQLHGLLEIARDTSAQTIAEGVESLSDLEMIRELGFDLAQGFFIADPAPTLHEPQHLDLLRM